MKGVAVTADVGASATEVFAALSDVRHHRLLTGRRLDLVEVLQDGEGLMLGVIDLNCPFGLRRRIATREMAREAPSLIWGVAAASSGSVALVSWSLTDITAHRTRVSLAVSPVNLKLLDHALLRLGGRHVLSGILRNVLQSLEALLAVIEPAGKNWSLDAANTFEPTGG